MDPIQSDSTSAELLDAAVEILKCKKADIREAAREGLERITALVRADLEKPAKSGRLVVKDRLAELAEAAKIAFTILRDPDVRSVLERHIRGLDACDLVELVKGRMIGATDTGAGHGDLAGLRACSLDKVFHRIEWTVLGHRQYLRYGRVIKHRRYIFVGVAGRLATRDRLEHRVREVK